MVQLGGNGAFTLQALKILDYFLATDVALYHVLYSGKAYMLGSFRESQKGGTTQCQTTANSNLCHETCEGLPATVSATAISEPL
jgi:hypothetical protein